MNELTSNKTTRPAKNGLNFNQNIVLITSVQANRFHNNLRASSRSGMQNKTDAKLVREQNQLNEASSLIGDSPKDGSFVVVNLER